MKKDKIKNKFEMKMSRRQVLKAGLYGGAAMMLPWRFMLAKANAAALGIGLSDPAVQPKFMQNAPNALDPGFKYASPYTNAGAIGVGQTVHPTGLVDGAGLPLNTPIFGYGQFGAYTWPGKTFEIQSGATTTTVEWNNNLGTSHLLPVDTSLHWCFSLPGYESYSIAANGVPIVTHLHGGHSDFQFDGNPEFFYTPGGAIVGPQWANVPGGFTNTFSYDNDVPAGNLWYHDHALGITRLNVYAGMAGFYFVRDDLDTGLSDNPLGLPAYPYELAYAIQDRIFTNTGALFYPAFQVDPFWVDFITPLIEANLEASGLFGTPPNLGPSALAEFFGDHMLVNGKIWPVAATDNVPGVEPRNYRMRLLNGCDSRFMRIRFRAARRPDGTDLRGAGRAIPFWVIGSDQGFGTPTEVNELLFAPGERYDIVFNFAGLENKRIIMENLAPDAPFGGGGARGPRANFFPDRQTDRIMAFDVTLSLNIAVPDAFNPANIPAYGGNQNDVTRATPRRVALFEGTDEFGRLQPLLGVAEPTVDSTLSTVNGSIAWHSPTTEMPGSNSTEIWEIYNATPDAHPIHLHLVNFEILDRQAYKADMNPQQVLQHNETFGTGFNLTNIKKVGRAKAPDASERAPKDMVTSLPGEVTRIKVTFDKDGRYVWHCHILSHEDHEMMRVLQVGGTGN